MPSRTIDTPNEWSDSVDIISRFLALQQIYSAKELDSYLQSLQHLKEHESDPEIRSTDVVVLCASAILTIPEAVFEWAYQQQSQNEEHQRNTVLVLCGGIGPCTSFVYDAIRASKKYCMIFDTIKGKPEGEVLKVMAERFYKLKIDQSGGQDKGFRILVSDRSNNCGADASEAQKVLEENGIRSPRSMVVVQDPAMSSRTMSSFEKVYESDTVQITCWPRLKQTRAGQEEKLRPEQDSRRELWSMNRFLDRIMGEHSGVIKAKSPIDNGRKQLETLFIEDNIIIFDLCSTVISSVFNIDRQRFRF
ncbi:Protein ydcF [Fusarium oxysporum f. sp. cubense race 1]|uniref:Protein ydcF n=1 Tax=Fusarium oxysporum f. sp. cubense (strain race 1) TaxID=1229664 RepID=N4U7X1_FUSC1|nr:Protein ydcF [Fusarium oxysporum f. sp. cubense race 1]